MKHPDSATLSVVDDNIFSKFPVEGGGNILQEQEEDYANSDSGSGSGSEGNEIEITNKEVHIISILLVAFTDYNTLQLADSLSRNIVSEKTHQEVEVK